MPLTFKNLERPPADIARGIAAAEAVFARAGVTPELAWQNSGFYIPWTDATAMRAWYRAEDAAVRAVFGSWRDAPLNVAMEWEAEPQGAESAP